MFVACWLLDVDRFRLLLVVRVSPFFVRCSLFVVCSLLFGVSGLLLVVC